MNEVNQVNIIGNLVKDPEFSIKTGGTHVCKFSIGHNSFYNNKKETSYFDVTCFGKTADAVAQIQGGSLVKLEGKLKQDSWKSADNITHYKVRIVAFDVILLSVPKTKSVTPVAEEGTVTVGEQPMIPELVEDSDIPF